MATTPQSPCSEQNQWWHLLKGVGVVLSFRKCKFLGELRSARIRRGHISADRKMLAHVKHKGHIPGNRGGQNDGRGAPGE